MAGQTEQPDEELLEAIGLVLWRYFRPPQPLLEPRQDGTVYPSFLPGQSSTRIPYRYAPWDDESGERLAAFSELIRAFDQSRGLGTEPPAGWDRLWWWAHIFGIEDWMETDLDVRRLSLGIDEPIERPSEEELFGEGGAPQPDRRQPERLYAIVNYFERIDSTGQITKSPREYQVVRDFALDAIGTTLEDVNRWLNGEGTPPQYPMQIDHDGGAAERDGDPSRPTVLALWDAKNADEVAPPTMELPEPDSGTPPDSGVDDTGPVTIIVGPEPAVGDSEPSDTDEDLEGHSRPAERAVRQDSAESAASSKASLVDPPPLEIDASEPDIDSAVDDAPTAIESTSGARGGDGPTSPGDSQLHAPPREAPTDSDSAVDDSDPVYVMAGPKPVIVDSDEEEAGAGKRTGIIGNKRVLVMIAAAAAIVIAIIGGGLMGGGEDDPGSVSAEPTGFATATVTATSTELPMMEQAPVANLVICPNGSSFSGVKQPDGTYRDPNDLDKELTCPE